MFLNVKGSIQGKLKHGLNWLRMLFENLGISGLQKKLKPICLDRIISKSCPMATCKVQFPGYYHCFPSTAHSSTAAAIPRRLSSRSCVSREKSSVTLMTKGLKFCLNVHTCVSPMNPL